MFIVYFRIKGPLNPTRNRGGREVLELSNLIFPPKDDEAAFYIAERVQKLMREAILIF